MTDKEELMKATETLKKYCDEHQGNGCAKYESDCLFSEICIRFGGRYDIGQAMKDIARGVKCFYE